MPATSPRPFVFVLMPFGEDYMDRYTLGIKAAAEETGAYCERVDEQIFADSVLQRVFNQIAKADIVVADMSDRNPNVFYEVGYAHALGKTTILLTAQAADIPFDLKHYPHVVFGSSISKLKTELQKRITYFLEHPERPFEIPLEHLQFFVSGKRLSAGAVFRFKTYSNQSLYVHLQLALHNSGPSVLDLTQVEIAILAPAPLYDCSEASTARIPDGKYIHILPSVGALPPGGWRPMDLTFRAPPMNFDAPREVPITTRVFGQVGFQDIDWIIELLPPEGEK